MSSLGTIMVLISIILFMYWGVRLFKHQSRKRLGWSALILLILGVVIASPTDDHSASKSTNEQSSSRAELKSSSSSSSHATKTVHQGAKPQARQSETHNSVSVLNKLVSYTSNQSAGPTGNYYWHVGKAHLTGFGSLANGQARFTADSQQRPATARAKLTYQEYASSKGGRQGDPLEPYAWPSQNPIVAISYAATGRTYHGYLWNRSHSIGDSLLGAKSYTSVNNFTTGTRPQNVGADKDGGMRYGEETVENYWSSHPGTHQIVEYQTTPIYQGNESLPRGSLVDIKSSDGTINTEIAVINDAEGIKINYNTGANNAKPYHRANSTTYKQPATASKSTQSSSPAGSHATTSGKWHVAKSGYVFVSQSNKYYTRVTNPGNYTCEPKAKAQSDGATEAIRGNEYAQP